MKKLSVPYTIKRRGIYYLNLRWENTFIRKSLATGNLLEAINLINQIRPHLNVVITLDTLKKFTDPMDKREARAFGIKSREFVSVGGTLIVLAHNNKHKGDDGRGIYARTSDIVDDADCAFGIDKVAESDVFLGKKITVEFTNTKSRGNVASTVGFTYLKKDHSYADLLASVEKLDETKLKLSKQEIELKESLERDKHIISEFRQAIIDGFDKKTY